MAAISSIVLVLACFARLATTFTKEIACFPHKYSKYSKDSYNSPPFLHKEALFLLLRPPQLPLPPLRLRLPQLQLILGQGLGQALGILGLTRASALGLEVDHLEDSIMEVELEVEVDSARFPTVSPLIAQARALLAPMDIILR